MIPIGFYVCPGHEMLDLAGPHCAFQSALKPSGAQAYSLHVISAAGGYVPGNAGLGVNTTRAGDVALDTLIMVGGKIAPMFEPQEQDAFRAAAARALRVASVCTAAWTGK